MLAGLFAVAILIARYFPETPTGRWLHVHLVELPLRSVCALERKYVIFALLVLIAGPALTAAAPIDLALIYALDLSLYMDAFVAIGTVAVMTRCKMVWSAFKSRASLVASALRKSRSHSGGRRAAKTRPHRPAINDDDAEPARVAVAA